MRFKKYYHNFLSIKNTQIKASNKIGLKKSYSRLLNVLNRLVFSDFWAGASKKLSFFIKKNKVFLISCLLAFFISDLFLIRSYSLVIPDKELAPLRMNYQVNNWFENRDSHKLIWENNIFHTGPIPLTLKAKIQNLDPVLSSLSFTLKGTIIHSNPKRSVATIQSGYSSKTFSYQVGDRIDKQAQVKKIKRGRVIFFNENNSRLEYILLPENQDSLDLSYKKEESLSSKKQKETLVNKKGENQYQVSRSDINDHLKKLPEILNQARVVPHRENGEIMGFRFQSIDKGSVFESLGFQVGDIIKKVDGEFIESPEQAIQLFERLKGSSGFKVLVEKEGQEVELDYNVNENAPIL